LPDSSPQSGPPAPTLSGGDAAAIMDAKKARGVEAEAELLEGFFKFFKTLGLDPQNQDHWDTLLGVLARARPKKRRGRARKWTEAEVAEFNNRVARTREVIKTWHTAWGDLLGELERIRSQHQLPERIAILQDIIELRRDPEMIQRYPRVLDFLIRFVLTELIKDTAYTTLAKDAALDASEAITIATALAKDTGADQLAGSILVGGETVQHCPRVSEAITIARILRQLGHYRHMTEDSLKKYVISGPVSGPVRARGK